MVQASNAGQLLCSKVASSDMPRIFRLNKAKFSILWFALALTATWFRVSPDTAVGSQPVFAPDDVPQVRVNVPYWDWEADDPYPSHAVFWFGQVGPESNYIDIRTIYYNEHLEIVAHIVDRNLYQSEPSPGS